MQEVLWRLWYRVFGFNVEFNADDRGFMCSSALKRALNRDSGSQKVRKINGSMAQKVLIPTMKPLAAGDVEK